MQKGIQLSEENGLSTKDLWNRINLLQSQNEKLKNEHENQILGMETLLQQQELVKTQLEEKLKIFEKQL